MAYDPHHEPMPVDCCVWAIRNAERAVLVDTGFSAEASARRQRDYLSYPIDALAEEEHWKFRCPAIHG